MDFSLILCGEKNFYRTAIVKNHTQPTLTQQLTQWVKVNIAFIFTHNPLRHKCLTG